MIVLPDVNEVTSSEELKIDKEEPNTGFPFAKLDTPITDFFALTEEMNQLHLKYKPDEHWYVLGSIVQKIVSHKLYRAGGYSSVADYCTRGLVYNRQHVYKLIQTVNFINEQWAQATTAAQRINIQRLFALGFTKLHILQQISPEKIAKLCHEGITGIASNGSPQKLDLEALTVAQLKQLLDDGSTSLKDSPKPKEQKLFLPHEQVSVINTKAQALAQYIKQCANELDNREALELLMQTITELSQTVAQGISDMIENEENLAKADYPHFEQEQKKRSEVVVLQVVLQVKQEREKVLALAAQIKQQSEIFNMLQQQAETIIKKNLNLVTEIKHLHSKIALIKRLS